ncbi:MAG: hypothetical protein K6E61_07000 [Bacteroidales bacterium]|nr:hypothetical protein [Bacteroidales bacterium]
MLLFDDITKDGRLWAVRYNEEEENALYKAFTQWNDVEWLRTFFYANKDDLESYFKVTDVNEAIYDTIEDSDKLQCLILDLNPDTDLEKLFRPLDNNQTMALILDKEKARLNNIGGHPSWLRLYAIRLEKGAFIITGGAIKLTATMAERKHTLQELVNMEQVRNFLLDEGIVDKESFIDYNDSV